jgi:hypothetical protein
MRNDLAAWQWANYPRNHRDRQNLLIHAITVPVFHAGTLAVLTAPWMGATSAFGGLLMCAFAMHAQHRGHAREGEKPIPFDGPLDAAARVFTEQWVTFPRYLFRGGFARAWDASR